MQGPAEREDEKRCPVCGVGVFTDVVYEERRSRDATEPVERPEHDPTTGSTDGRDR